ncbi:MAG: chromosomal replication initiator protein DnaA, partial [Clostridia bacterium]|nr:chromosomal replication initiator protein DnaA [Clostridia bacterium]
LNNSLGERIREAIRESRTFITDFEPVVATSKEEYRKLYEEDERAQLESAGSPINPKFTFESFVVGPSNEFIHAAARAVAENPGEAYNPLFIYGGTGLGKTHILMAIANELKLKKPSLNVLYATCEQFTNQFIESISRGKNNGMEFRRKYRNVDVLLIDDIQFLTKKQGTQAEFFHAFNELVMQDKQIVLTSDRPPKEIEVLEERLRTRFEGGLLADVQTPDIETKIAILRKKAEEKKSIVDIKVLAHIAEMNDEGDIRSLIGKLNKVLLASKLHEVPITISLVNEALKESAGEKEIEIETDDIINRVCAFYKVSKADVLSKKKNKEIVLPRQVCAYLMTELMSIPLETIGKAMGGRDHSTILYSRDKIAETIKLSDKLATEVNDLKKMLLKQ